MFAQKRSNNTANRSFNSSMIFAKNMALHSIKSAPERKHFYIGSFAKAAGKEINACPAAGAKARIEGAELTA